MNEFDMYEFLNANPPPRPMDVRDEFAIRILAAMVSNNWPIVGEDAANTSEIAYAAADEMLKERAK